MSDATPGPHPAQSAPHPANLPVPYPQPYPAAPAHGQQHPAAYAHPAVMTVVLNRKEPVLAAVLSLLFPGVGQLYNGQTVAGILFLVAWFVNSIITVFFFWLVVPVLVQIGIQIWAVIDAVLGAQRANHRLATQVAQQTR